MASEPVVRASVGFAVKKKVPPSFYVQPSVFFPMVAFLAFLAGREYSTYKQARRSPAAARRAHAIACAR